MWICIAPRREHTSKALRYGTHAQGISQFYLHTARSCANGMNHTCHCNCEIPWERVPYLGTLKVCSWRGAIQVHVYLYLTFKSRVCIFCHIFLVYHYYLSQVRQMRVNVYSIPAPVLLLHYLSYIEFILCNLVSLFWQITGYIFWQYSVTFTECEFCLFTNTCANFPINDLNSHVWALGVVE